jgi:hypothetical protein
VAVLQIENPEPDDVASGFYCNPAHEARKLKEKA